MKLCPRTLRAVDETLVEAGWHAGEKGNAVSIDASECEIRGSWNLVDGRVEADINVTRIESLIRDELREVGRDASGWDILYVDPRDGRYWELLYLESHRHGGGPSTLRCLSREDARQKYGISA